MAERINNLFACLAGCVVGALLGLLCLIRFDEPVLALLSAGTAPAIACWLGGISDKNQIAKIFVFASIGWLLTYMFQPVVAQSASTHAERVASMPMLGYEWHGLASLVSTLLALVGAYFAPADDEHIDSSSDEVM